jgi:RNA polymerase sigma factor (sigma-70 family)
MVLAAGGDSSMAGPALEKLCGKYWPPLYAFARRHGLAREAAEDAVQGFILTLLQQHSLAGVVRDGARFRSWLLAGFVHHLANVRRRDTAVKRGGRMQTLAFGAVEDVERLMPASEKLTPAEAFDQGWARLVLTSAMNRLRQDQERAGKGATYAHLEPVVTAQTRQPYAELAALTGMAEKQVAVVIHRLRARLRDILRAEVAQTVATPDCLEDEVRYLMAIVQRP